MSRLDARPSLVTCISHVTVCTEFSLLLGRQFIKLAAYRDVAVPKRFDTAFRNWEYVPHSLATWHALDSVFVVCDA